MSATQAAPRPSASQEMTPWAAQAPVPTSQGRPTGKVSSMRLSQSLSSPSHRSGVGSHGVSSHPVSQAPAPIAAKAPTERRMSTQLACIRALPAQDPGGASPSPSAPETSSVTVTLT